MTSVETSTNQTLRSYPVYTDCCGGAPTSVVKKINFNNTLLCICLSNCWFCHQAWKRKDMNCYDATHSCTTCGKKKGEYSAC